MNVRNKFDWDKIGPPEDFQTDLSTQELLTQIKEEVNSSVTDSTSDYNLLSVPQIFKKYEKKETVRIRISKQLYLKLLEIQKQANSSLSISQFLDILFSKIFK